jgi:glycosyltransferase involved in cell wall biosynthesis
MMSVSVVIPTKNRFDSVVASIQSVLNQTFPILEILVIDDCSDDGINHLNEFFKNEERVQIWGNKLSIGAGAARNIGIQAAKGDWIAFLDDDDIWMRDKIDKQIALLEINPNAVACTCSHFRIKASSATRIYDVRLPENIDLIYRQNTLGGCSNLIAKRKVLCQIGGFNPRLKSCQDWDIWIKLFQYGKIVSCTEPLLLYRDWGGVKITRNVESLYKGRLAWYQLYSKKMSPETKRSVLIDLLFYRSLYAVSTAKTSLLTLKIICTVLYFRTGRLKIVFLREYFYQIIKVIFKM